MVVIHKMLMDKGLWPAPIPYSCPGEAGASASRQWQKCAIDHPHNLTV